MISLLIKLGASFACGFIFGIERRVRSHAVGIRTLVLISLSSTLLCILSKEMADCGAITGDPTRITAGVVSGIGFIGGGVILKQGLNIRGLTTAAVIFTASALGLACGFDLYFLAFATLTICLLTLTIMDKLERILFPAEQTKYIRIKFSESKIEEEKIKNIITSNGMLILDVNIDYSANKNSIEYSYLVKTPHRVDAVKMAKQIAKLNDLDNFSISEK